MSSGTDSPLPITGSYSQSTGWDSFPSSPPSESAEQITTQSLQTELQWHSPWNQVGHASEHDNRDLFAWEANTSRLHPNSTFPNGCADPDTYRQNNSNRASRYNYLIPEYSARWSLEYSQLDTPAPLHTPSQNRHHTLKYGIQRDLDGVGRARKASKALHHVMASQRPMPFARPPVVMDNFAELFEQGLKINNWALDDIETFRRHKIEKESLERIFEDTDTESAIELEDAHTAVIPTPTLLPSATFEDDTSSLYFDTLEDESDNTSPSASPLASDIGLEQPTQHMSHFSTMSIRSLPEIITTPSSPTKLQGIASKKNPMPSLKKITNTVRSKSISLLTPFANPSSPKVPEADDQKDDYEDFDTLAYLELDPDRTGFPSLPFKARCLWVNPFPGNTPGLCHTLLTWHALSHKLYLEHNPPDRLLRLHPLFPYPPSKPVNIPLVSVSFWDTSVAPHRELRFIGPGDVQSLTYAEVDTIDSAEQKEESDHTSDDEDAKRGRRIKQTSTGKNNDNDKKKKKSSTPKRPSGSGRWSLITIKGFPRPSNIPEGEAPWLIIAWPTSLVTKTSQCLHTLYPDQQLPSSQFSSSISHSQTSTPPLNIEPPSPPSQPQQQHPWSRLKRITNLPNPYFVQNNLRAFNCTKSTWSSISMTTLHLPNSSPSSPTANSFSIFPPQTPPQIPNSTFPSPSSESPPTSLNDSEANNANPPLPLLSPNHSHPWSLNRMTLLFEHQGSGCGMPLVEGYRTDVWEWRAWMEAVGRGRGKIVWFVEV